MQQLEFLQHEDVLVSWINNQMWICVSASPLGPARLSYNDRGKKIKRRIVSVAQLHCISLSDFILGLIFASLLSPPAWRHTFLLCHVISVFSLCCVIGCWRCDGAIGRPAAVCAWRGSSMRSGSGGGSHPIHVYQLRSHSDTCRYWYWYQSSFFFIIIVVVVVVGIMCKVTWGCNKTHSTTY